MIEQQIKQIKQMFRQMMDGATSQSMRDKGLNYHLNWGVPLPRLQAMALEIKTKAEVPLYDVAIALWKENVRECKILATMLMPPDEVLSEVVDIWMEQTPNVEIAEQAAFNLYQYLPYAADKAYQWIASPDDLPQICGYHIFSRLFIQKLEPNERGINEYLDQSLVAIQNQNVMLCKAAYQSILHFAELGMVYERIARSALSRYGFTL